VENPHVPAVLYDHEVAITLVLIALLGAVFLNRLDRPLGWHGVDVVLLGSSFPHPADVETKEVEALIDVDHLGLLRRQPQAWEAVCSRR
jgi:hypothetical protein